MVSADRPGVTGRADTIITGCEPSVHVLRVYCGVEVQYDVVTILLVVRVKPKISESSPRLQCVRCFSPMHVVPYAMTSSHWH